MDALVQNYEQWVKEYVLATKTDKTKLLIWDIAHRAPAMDTSYEAQYDREDEKIAGREQHILSLSPEGAYHKIQEAMVIYSHYLLVHRLVWPRDHEFVDRLQAILKGENHANH